MKPSLLVASPALDGSIFGRSVILLCEDSDSTGSMGLVINKTLAIGVSEVLEQLEIEAPAGAQQSVYWGGPVEPGAGLVVCRSGGAVPEGCVVQVEGSDLCVSASPQLLRNVACGRWKGPWLLCLGYAGWGPNQLDQEIEEGSWLVADLDPSVVFDLPVEARWEHCISSLGLSAQTMMWIPPVEE